MCDRIQPRQEIRFTPTALVKWLSPLVLVLGVVCTGEGTVAQIVPDETLGSERSLHPLTIALKLFHQLIGTHRLRASKMLKAYQN